MDLTDYRKRMDEIDRGIVDLFQQRMDLSIEIAQYKKKNNLPIHDSAREQQKLKDITGSVKEGQEAYVSALYSLLFELSRAEQERFLNSPEQV